MASSSCTPSLLPTITSLRQLTRRQVVPRSTSPSGRGRTRGPSSARALAAAKTGPPRLGVRRRNSSTSRRTTTSARIYQKVRSQRLAPRGFMWGTTSTASSDRSAPALAPPITWENFRPGTSTPASEFGSTISRRSSGRPFWSRAETSSSPAGLLIACSEPLTPALVTNCGASRFHPAQSVFPRRLRSTASSMSPSRRAGTLTREAFKRHRRGPRDQNDYSRGRHTARFQASVGLMESDSDGLAKRTQRLK